MNDKDLLKPTTQNPNTDIVKKKLWELMLEIREKSPKENLIGRLATSVGKLKSYKGNFKYKKDKALIDQMDKLVWKLEQTAYELRNRIRES